MPSRQTTVRFATTCYTFALASISSSCRWGQDRATKTPKISVRRNRLCQMIRVRAWFLPQILRISMFRMSVTRCTDVKWLSQLYKGATNEARISTLCSFWKQHLRSVWEYLLKCLFFANHEANWYKYDSWVMVSTYSKVTYYLGKWDQHTWNKNTH